MTNHAWEYNYLGFSNFWRSSTTNPWNESLRITGSTWNFLSGITTPSDSRLKDDVRDLPSEECLEVLRQVSAQSYVRNDLPDTSRRIGFIAHEAQAALGSSIAGTNVIGKMTREVSGGTEDLKTLSYERMSVILWQCTRSLLARVEVLEARLR